MALRDAVLGWFQRTAVWRAAASLKDKIRVAVHRTSDKVRALFGYRPKAREPRLTPSAERP